MAAPLGSRGHRWHGVYLAVMAAAVGAISAIGVFGRGDGSTETVVSARGEPYEMVTTGVYAYNPERLVAEGIGWDLVTLLLAVPALLLVAREVTRGSLRARLVAIGLLGYVLYQYLMYAMAWAVGPLLPAFIVLYAASLLGIAWFAATISLGELPAHVTDRFPRHGMAAFCVAVALLLLGMWTPMIADVLAGHLEGTLIGQTTLVVQGLDLGIVVPLALTTVVMVWRRHPLGYLLAAVLVVKGLTMATAICAMVLSAWFVEGELDRGPLTIFAVIAALSLVLLVAVFRAIRETPQTSADTARSELPASATPR